MSGFVALHREAFSHPLLKDAERFRAWFWMVTEACWKPAKFDINGKTVLLQRGQFVASRSRMAEAFSMSPSAVERFLTRLQTEQMIGRETGQGRSVITICNYDKYNPPVNETGQATGQVTGQRPDSDRTAKEQGNKETREEDTNVSPSSAGECEQAGDDLFDDPQQSPDASSAKPKRTKVPTVIPDWIPDDAWAAFLEMRKDKKAAPTARAKSLLIAKLERLRRNGHDPGAVLDQSTMNNWTDVYELKDHSNGNRNHNANRNQSGRVDPAVAVALRWADGGDGEGPAGTAGRRDDGPSGSLLALPSARSSGAG